MDKNKLQKFYENFSLITVSDNKIPNFAWKNEQTKKQSWEQFLQRYNYNGGQIKSDGTPRPKTDNFGIVTGFDYLECLDIDLKVIKNLSDNDKAEIRMKELGFVFQGFFLNPKLKAFSII